MDAEQITKVSLFLDKTSGQTYSPSRINSFGPLLQGALMECIDSRYAKYLHELPFNPYSQACSLDGRKGIVWTIAALNDETKSNLVDPLMNLDQITLRAIGETFSVKEKTVETLPLKALVGELKEGDGRRFKISFATPTAFKSKGEYVFMPTQRLVFQNLLMHYNQVYSGSSEIDEETVEYITQNVRISAYNLKSRYFACSAGKKTKIPAFVGDITIDVEGKQPLKGLIGMLLRFGEFAGVGIKTSMGMGRMEYFKLDRDSEGIHGR